MDIMRKIYSVSLLSICEGNVGHTAFIPHVNAFNIQKALPLTPISPGIYATTTHPYPPSGGSKSFTTTSVGSSGPSPLLFSPSQFCPGETTRLIFNFSLGTPPSSISYLVFVLAEVGVMVFSLRRSRCFECRLSVPAQ